MSGQKDRTVKVVLTIEVANDPEGEQMTNEAIVTLFNWEINNLIAEESCNQLSVRNFEVEETE